MSDAMRIATHVCVRLRRRINRDQTPSALGPGWSAGCGPSGQQYPRSPPSASVMTSVGHARGRNGQTARTDGRRSNRSNNAALSGEGLGARSPGPSSSPVGLRT